MKEIKIDERRDVVIPGTKEETLAYALEHFIACAARAITEKGSFACALSGGSTPKLLYQALSSPKNKERIDWSKVYLFWSDERAEPPTSKESNYRMAMKEGGLEKLPIPKNQIFRMCAESEIEKNALLYEKMIEETLKRPFDLVMLGVGEDGHTASLFPNTDALYVVGKKVAANFVPQKKTWRMTLTYECINAATTIVLYLLGKDKAPIIEKIFTSSYVPDTLPTQRIGTPEHKALFILDEEAGKNLATSLK